MQYIFTLNEINKIAAQVWQQNQHKKVWVFHGDMGAGKTTFIHALCEYLGVTSAIGSPTYAIINEYASTTAGLIYHLDLYRLNDEEEAMQAGVEDVLYSGNLCLVEWPGKAPALLPSETLHLYINLVDDTKRSIHW